MVTIQANGALRLHFQTGDSVRKRRPQPGPAAARNGDNSGPNNIRDHRGRAASKFPSFHRCRHRLDPPAGHPDPRWDALEEAAGLRRLL